MPDDFQVTPKQYAALVAACDTIIPSVDDKEEHREFWALKASDLDVPDKILEVMAGQPAVERNEFLKLLDLLSGPMLGMTWSGGGLESLVKLNHQQREAVFQSWSQSQVGQLRKAFTALKKLTAFLFYGSSSDQENPAWQAIQYPGPIGEPARAANLLESVAVSQETVLHCDAVVIGSGAGGGLAAGMLAEAGQEVIIVEKGELVSEQDFDQREAEMVSRLYERRGAFTTEDGAITIFAGNCVGGGTTINWAGIIPPPDELLAEWSEQHQLPHLLEKDFQASVDEALRSIKVSTTESLHNHQSQALIRGSENLGHSIETIPRNTEGCLADECKRCGYCGLGCPRGSKKSMLRTWIKRACEHGAKILAQTEVARVVVENGQAEGVEAFHLTADGRRHRVSIHAKIVVLAAGAIHSPAILIRSGVEHTHAGRHLFLHPTVAAFGIYREKMNPWWGAMMSAMNNTFAQMDGQFGCRIETPPLHAGLYGLALPWVSGVQHKEQMLAAARIGAFIVLARDKHGGRVKVTRRGQVSAGYRLHPYDLNHLLQGLEQAARIHLAAGAEEVLFPHNRLRSLSRQAETEEIESFFHGMQEWGWQPNEFALFSAHQMGTCRMGGDSASHPVTPEGELAGIKNLYVTDASVFPASSGVNPTGTILSLSYHTIKNLIQSRL